MSDYPWWPLEWCNVDSKNSARAHVHLPNGKKFIVFRYPIRIWRDNNGLLVASTFVIFDLEFELKAYLIAEAQTP